MDHARMECTTELDEIAAQLESVWSMLKLAAAPDLVGAALRDDPDACLVIGLCYAAGRGMARNPDKARAWFERAMRGGEQVAREILTAMKRGETPEIDFGMIATVAAGWARRRGA